MANCSLRNEIADYEIDSIISNGICRKIFHVKCIDAPNSSIKLFAKNRSFYHFCEECDPFAYTNIARNVIENTNRLENMHKQLLYLSDKIENLASQHPHQGRLTRSKLKNSNANSEQSSSSSTKRKSEEVDKDTDIGQLNPFIKKQSLSVSTNPVSITTQESRTISSTETITASSPSASVQTSLPNSSSQPFLLPAVERPAIERPAVERPAVEQPAIEDNRYEYPIEHGLKVVEGQKQIFISKLAPSTNALDTKTYLIQKIGKLELITVEKMLQRNYSKYASFKISCPDSIFHLLNSPLFWLNGVIVHEFVNRNSKIQPHHFRQ
ncbi:uncharacterized protein LOC129909844 [Episyrphus balteatus]|uniref:uncharacterized protein LOC129909844 n=1 Tax=Episyrphus balteatus TaxID=286459 RepID=UPI002485504C|nr:uncharacterized protein LOC129909844 [Episyrphus balteatus]